MSQPAWPTRHTWHEPLKWVHPPEEFGQFRPFKPLHAETPQGTYSVVRCGYRFDAWFTARDGAMTFLGTSRTLQMAMKQCEHREGRRHATPQT